MPTSEPNRVHFTKRAIDALACPPGRKREWFYDDESRLALMVTAAGGRTFYIYKRVNNRPQRIRVGAFPDLSIEQARKTAARILGEIAEGKDPADERRRRRGEPTLTDLFKSYTEHHANLHNSLRTRQTDESRFKLAGPLANRRISTITREDVQRLHKSIVDKAKAKAGDDAPVPAIKGMANANRAVQLIRRLYNFATDELGFKGGNPAARIRTYRERSRERYLLPHELPRLMAALDDRRTNPTIADFIRLALFTGARRANLQAMRWNDLDLDAATWTIPGDETKEKQPIHLPLAGPALDILKRRRAEANGSAYVFPAARADAKSPHLSEPKATWKEILRRAGIDDLRVHDLRRSLGSWQAAAGASLVVIGKSLGHAAGSAATGVYARLDIDPVRASVANAVGAMLRAADKGADHE